MNFSSSLVLVSLSLTFVSCEKCSEALHEAFKRDFDISEKCDDCVILPPRISFGGGNWAGFCAGNEFCLFRDWECRDENDFLNLPESFAVVTNESCELVGSFHGLHEHCLKVFTDALCNRPAGTQSKNERDETDFVLLKDFPTDVEVQSASTRKLLRPTRVRSVVMNKTSIGIKTTEVLPIVGESTTEMGTTAANTNQTSKLGVPSGTTPVSSTTSTSPSFCIKKGKDRFPPILRRGDCEVNEYFFNGHCYFLKSSTIDIKWNSTPNTTYICQSQHPEALGLAVETEEENEYVMKLVNTFPIANFLVFSSGIREFISYADEWRGWNTIIDQSVLPFREGGRSPEPGVYYCIDVCNRTWFMVSHKNLSYGKFIYTVCERPYNPRNIQPDIHEYCLKEYRKSDCYNSEKHVDYCCRKDEAGKLWFSCPNSWTVKNYENCSCDWHCDPQGVFSPDEPYCKGLNECVGFYNNMKYAAPVTRYATGKCPHGYWGYFMWYCTENGTFTETPDLSFCCENGDFNSCKSVDSFLNLWRGCPSKKVTKKTSCPPGMILDTAVVEWECLQNGSFNGSAPDYSKCNISKAIKCRKQDRFGTEWKAESGSTIKKNCPAGYKGLCFWYCQESGIFDGPEPDCSRCVADWMNEITDKINNQTNYTDVMEIMQNYTESQDLTIGYAHVLNLTANCVSLFKHQVSECKLNVFEDFLKSYSKILKNVAGNQSTWSNFSVLNRRNYSEQILETTQAAAFINLEIGNEAGLKYNETFARAQTDGFDFFVAYNPSVGSRFPLENFSQSDWHLDIKEINESMSNFAAMGLVMTYELSSLMFPQGNQTQDLQINARAITFKVAASINGEVVADPNVVVSVSFKHTNRTRMPDTVVIRRRLHDGEQPSGVFNSTLCFYYRDKDWTTEGCSVTFTSKDRTNCTCNHLSTIGLLMSIHKYEPNLTLEVVSTVSSGITIISLILALVVFYFFDKAGNDRLLIGKNLCFCLLLGHIMLLTVLDKKFFNIPDSACMVFAILLHYVFTAAFAWMFVEGCHLYRMLVVVFDSGAEYRLIYVMIGYGMPLAIVVVTQVVGFIFQEQPYGQDEVCWLKSPTYVWAFVGPVIVLTSINFCILVVAMKLAVVSKLRTEKSNFAAFMLWMKAWVSLSALLGITWLFGLAYFNYNEPLVYAFVFFNGLQGFFIFLFRCVLCEQYKTMFWKKMKSWCWKTKSGSQKKTEIVKSETKVFAVSGSKSQTESRDSGYDPGFEDGRKYSKPETKASGKPEENSSRANAGGNVTLTPAVSEAYLRNRMIARNFSLRKSKATLLAESDNFPELSYHDIFNRN